MRRSQGAVALEFLLLFPMLVALLYGAATIGVVAYQKYEMQRLANQATTLSTRVDRSRTGDVAVQAVTISDTWLTEQLSEYGVSDSGCQISEHDSASVECFIEWQPDIRQISFGFLGAFPPLPNDGLLRVEALIPF